MKKRKIAVTGQEVGAIGLGCMSFGGAFGDTDDETSFKAMDAALAAGIDFWDTSNVYGDGWSERVIGDYCAATGARPFIATKVGIVRNGPFNNAEDYIRAELEKSLERLKTDRVQLYYIHRRERARPVEEVAETMARLVEEGLIDGYGLSEVAPNTLRRAQKVHPCMAVQSEYSLWSRQPELGMIRACRDLGVTFVPFSPVARGFLTDASVDPANFKDGDFRKPMPRFSGENYPRNVEIWHEFKAFCEARGWTMAAVALAWVLHQDDTCLPIPATRTAAHLNEWLEGAEIDLSPDDLAEIDRILPPGWAHGDRYSDGAAANVERYC